MSRSYENGIFFAFFKVTSAVSNNFFKLMIRNKGKKKGETFKILILFEDISCWLLFSKNELCLPEIRLCAVNANKHRFKNWNRKHKKSKTISLRVDVLKNLTEMDIFCFKSAAIIAVYQIFYLID